MFSRSLALQAECRRNVQRDKGCMFVGGQSLYALCVVCCARARRKGKVSFFVPLFVFDWVLRTAVQNVLGSSPQDVKPRMKDRAGLPFVSIT